jgi:hypothetical protein
MQKQGLKMTECNHKWKYRIGQGRWYSCALCQAIGDAGPLGMQAIEPVSCEIAGCGKPATHLNFSHPKPKGRRCYNHQQLP